MQLYWQQIGHGSLLILQCFYIIIIFFVCKKKNDIGIIALLSISNGKNRSGPVSLNMKLVSVIFVINQLMIINTFAANRLFNLRCHMNKYTLPKVFPSNK